MEQERKRIWARPFNFVSETDAKLYELFAGTLPEELKYASTNVLVADDGTPLAFLPVQISAIIDKPTFRPKTEPFGMLLALNEMIRIARYEGQKQGFGELFVIGSSDEMNLFAKKLNLEEIKVPVYRMKI